MIVQPTIPDAVEQLINELAAHSAFTAEHSERVARYAARTADALGLSDDEAEIIARSALVHDLGKMYLAPQIIERAGPLQDWEWREMRRHPIASADLIADIEGFDEARELVLYHHERVDGSGYPFGLQNDEIPLGARILAVVDSYDAMTSDRPYRSALSHGDALAEIERGTGTQYCPRAVAAFRAAIAADSVA